MHVSAAGPNPAIAYALEAPPLFKPQATAEAVAVTALKEIMDNQAAQSEQVVQILQSSAGSFVDAKA